MLKIILIKVFAVMVSTMLLLTVLLLVSTDFVSSIIPAWNTTLYSPEWVVIIAVLIIIGASILIERLTYIAMKFSKGLKVKKNSNRATI